MKSIVIALSGLAVACVPSIAMAASQTLDVGNFTSVEIASGIDAEIIVGEPLSVRVESSNQSYIDLMRYEVQGEKFAAWVDWKPFDFLNFDDRDIRLTITVPSLGSVSTNSGSNATVTGIESDVITLRADSGSDLSVVGAAGKIFAIKAFSGSDVTIEGTCESADYEAGSGSDVDASRLLCADVVAAASSGSNVQAHASASIRAHASSGSDIGIFGQPDAIEERASSGGTVYFAQ